MKKEVPLETLQTFEKEGQQARAKVRGKDENARCKKLHLQAGRYIFKLLNKGWDLASLMKAMHAWKRGAGIEYMHCKWT